MYMGLVAITHLLHSPPKLGGARGGLNNSPPKLGGARGGLSCLPLSRPSLALVLSVASLGESGRAERRPPLAPPT